jgi:hypothetical protein
MKGKRLITAAEGWLFLAGQLRRLEVAFENDDVVPEGRPKTRVETKARTT